MVAARSHEPVSRCLAQTARARHRHLFGRFREELEDKVQRFAVNHADHFNEHVEGFAFIFENRIFLSVRTEMDSFFKVVHLAQMFLPSDVDHLKHRQAFNIPHNLRAYFFFLAPVELRRIFYRFSLYAVLPQRLEFFGRNREIDEEIDS